jgi:hypothetical protein
VGRRDGGGLGNSQPLSNILGLPLPVYSQPATKINPRLKVPDTSVISFIYPLDNNNGTFVGEIVHLSSVGRAGRILKVYPKRK